MKLRKLILAAATMTAFMTCAAQAQSVVNGNLETGNIAGWTTFLTSNGTIGEDFGLPDIVPFDIDNDGIATNVARFQAGETVYNPAVGHTSEGGGIFQSFTVPAAGSYSLSADIAAENLSGGTNDTGGVARLIVDGVTRDTRDFAQLLGGFMPHGTIQRSNLAAVVPLSAGTHEIRIQFTRHWLNGDGIYAVPVQYVDNIRVPEPSGVGLMAMVGAGVVGRRRQRV